MYKNSINTMRLVKIKLQIIKKMIKMIKQRYFDVSFRYSRVSWGVLGCPGVIRLTPTCVQGSTNGTNGIPISFKVLPMVP